VVLLTAELIHVLIAATAMFICLLIIINIVHGQLSSRGSVYPSINSSLQERETRSSTYTSQIILLDNVSADDSNLQHIANTIYISLVG
jgi:mannitol/fructose-specific phosphotransferase system IIA component